MSWLDELEKGDSTGDFDVSFYNGHRQAVPLKYPTGAAKMKVINLAGKVQRAKGNDVINATEEMYRLIIASCLDWPDKPNDQAVQVLYCETGGPTSPLLKRCVEMMGLGGWLNLPKPDDDEEAGKE